MKLGEALTRRADLQARLNQNSSRLRASTVVQEGDQPPEDPETLLAELDALCTELEALITAINLTNSASQLPDGRTVTAALARREVLARRHSALRSAADAATEAQARYSRSEIRLVRLVDVARLHKAADDLARERRELDTAIQEHNWTTDLIEA